MRTFLTRFLLPTLTVIIPMSGAHAANLGGRQLALGIVRCGLFVLGFAGKLETHTSNQIVTASPATDAALEASCNAAIIVAGGPLSWAQNYFNLLVQCRPEGHPGLFPDIPI
jgi:hypothetical protein